MDITINKDEQEVVVLIIDEILKRDGHTIDDTSPEAQTLYSKCKENIGKVRIIGNPSQC